MNHNDEGKPDIRIYTRFAPKLTHESKLFAAGRLACNIPCAEIVKEIKQKYGIEITKARIGQLLNTKVCKEYYDVCHKQFLTERSKAITDIAIGVQETRIKDAEKIRQRLFNMMDVLQKRIDNNEIGDVSKDYIFDILKQYFPYKEDQAVKLIRRIWEGREDYTIKLMKEVRETIETHLRVLKFAHDDTVEMANETKHHVQPSLTQFVDKQQLIINDPKMLPTIPIKDIKEGEIENRETPETNTRKILSDY